LLTCFSITRIGLAKPLNGFREDFRVEKDVRVVADAY
jgi:hypothetical protein